MQQSGARSKARGAEGAAVGEWGAGSPGRVSERHSLHSGSHRPALHGGGHGPGRKGL